MLSERTKHILPIIRDCLTKEPITKAWLFGSCSRGEDKADSDVDILVEYDKNARISLFVISKIMVTMENATGRKIDLVENGRLLPFATESAEHDKLLIYEKES